MKNWMTLGMKIKMDPSNFRNFFKISNTQKNHFVAVLWYMHGKSWKMHIQVRVEIGFTFDILPFEK